MKLSEARSFFEVCRKRGENAFIIRKHCWKDHPERRFSPIELLNLLLGSGRLKSNPFPSAKPDSFLWCCKDRAGKNVEIAVIFESAKITAIAISAYRK
ncbi:MAG: hypothetical protein KA436_01540 [Oligoflexales bacterium]|nr:hypothetical protein [Oligoflexales bacterium]